MGRRSRRRQPNRRRNKRGARKSAKTSSLIKLANSALRGINTSRSLTYIPKQVPTGDSKVKQSWLEKALPYLTIVMQLFGSLITEPLESFTQAKVYVSSAVQCILFGAEDILYDHPITGEKVLTINDEKITVRTLNYSTARVHSVNVTISFMGALSSRAGRVACVLRPLTREKSESMVIHGDYPADWTAEVKTFLQLTQMPGCVVSPSLRPITLNMRATGFSGSAVEVGVADRPVNVKDKLFKGGLPLFELLVGYQDLAADSADPHLTYSIADAAICVELTGSISLSEPLSAPRYMRSKVLPIYAATDLTVTEGNMRRSIPVSSLYRDYTGALVTSHGVENPPPAFTEPPRSISGSIDGFEALNV